MNLRRVVSLGGTINFESLTKTTTKILELHNENPDEYIHLFINSSGGGMAGYGFYDFIRSTGINVHTYGLGYVDSIAVVVFLSGNRRLVSKHASMTFHQNGITFEKESKVPLQQLRRFLTENNMYAKFYEELIEERTGGKLTAIAVRQMQLEEHVLTAQEIVSYGLAHDIWH